MAYANIEEQKAYHKRWRILNKERLLKHEAEYRIQNREVLRERVEKHRTENLSAWAAKEAKRRATKLQRTPSWADFEAIKTFFINCPKGYHVDHIVPLKGRNVSGLHTVENLQYLPATENLRKHNKHFI